MARLDEWLSRFSSLAPRQDGPDREAIQALTTGFVWAYGAAVVRTLAPEIRGKILETIPDIDLFNPPRSLRKKHRRPRVLYLGPMAFKEGVWNTRYKYVFPDLIGQVSRRARVCMLTGPIPDFARDGIEALKSEFSLEVMETGLKKGKVGLFEHWTAETFRAAAKVKPDIITNVFGGVAFGVAAGVAGRFTGARSVLRIAGDEISSRIAIGSYEEGSDRHRIDSFGEYIGFNLADSIIVMSDMERKRIQRRLVDRPDRVLVSPRGIDLSKFQPKSYYGDSWNRRIFSYVGRKSLEKGFDVIEAAALLVEQEAPDVRFRFAGTFTPGEIGNRSYVGFVEAEDLPRFYGESHAFVLCSRTEGFPQALMEAMAMGQPCILSRHLFEETFKDGEDAILVDVDPASVAQAVLRLASDPALGARLAVRSRQIAERQFGREIRAKAYRKAILGHFQRGDQS